MTRIVSWAIVILWLLLIFSFSHQPASESRQLSTGVTKSVVETVEKVSPDKTFNVDKVHHIIRKNAHFFLYFVLGVLVMNALGNTWGSLKGVLVGGSFLFCIFYALSDEFHQVFVPGRGPQMSDVLIDGAGAGLGIALFIAFRRKMQKK